MKRAAACLWLLLGSALTLPSCSCGRHADTAGTPPPAAPPAGVPAAAEGARPDTDAIRAASTVHAYLAAVVDRNWRKADAFWSGGQPSTAHGDFLVRTLDGLRRLQADNDVPRPLDGESPPQGYEIPVHLRADLDAGPRRIDGWYRVRRKADGDGWEIVSASLQPAFD
jgi:hypothetical protein